MGFSSASLRGPYEELEMLDNYGDTGWGKAAYEEGSGVELQEWEEVDGDWF